MRYIYILILFLCICPLRGQNPGLVPRPQKLVCNGENRVFTVSSNTRIVYDDECLKAIAELFSEDFFKRTGIAFRKTKAKGKSKGSILLKYDHSFPNEAYRLNITESNITLQGSESGIFYGIQTLLQLLPSERLGQRVTIPCLEIEDAPRFKYRGAMLDVSRYFYSVNEVKRFIDLLAHYKINRFHWHLTDNQGWRIEIKKYPFLTKIGSWRTGSWIDPAQRQFRIFDGLPFGGFYTQEEIREVVSYAKGRYITIIPEIDMPGHSESAMKAYPWLGCDEKRYVPELCAGKETTYQFLKDVLDEVIPLFPSEIIHIGGDEVNKSRWMACPDCRAKMQELKLDDAVALQHHFIGEINRYLQEKGKKMIGWDEILEGGISPNVMVMGRFAEKGRGGDKAALQRHQVVLAPLYLDYYQGKREEEPLCYGEFLPLKTVYDFDPMQRFPPEYQEYVSGVQANIWTECIHGTSKLGYMAFPRLLALAEIAWSPDGKDYPDFFARLGKNLIWLERIGVNYRIPDPLETLKVEPDEKKITVTLTAATDGSEIYYSLAKGMDLLRNGIRYTDPIQLDLSSQDSVTIWYMVQTPSGKICGTRTKTYSSALLIK